MDNIQDKVLRVVLLELLVLVSLMLEFTGYSEKTVLEFTEQIVNYSEKATAIDYWFTKGYGGPDYPVCKVSMDTLRIEAKELVQFIGSRAEFSHDDYRILEVRKGIVDSKILKSINLIAKAISD